MPNAFKQFGAKGTGWFKNLFQLSLWRLTVLYTVILAFILFISSSFIYGAFSKRLEHRFRNNRLPLIENIRTSPPPPTAAEVRADLVRSILIVNGLLLTIAALLSYFLAQATIKPLEEMDEKQKKFFGDASHELRTPLSILKIDLENNLENNELTDKEKNRLLSHLEEVDRISKLVNNLLTLARFDEHSASKEQNLSPVDLVAINKTVIHQLQSLAAHHQVTINFVTSEENIFINSNEDILSQILTNIIKNGIVYNKPTGTVTISIKKTADFVLITVADTGLGMTNEETKKVFDRFYRADKSRSSQTGGSGLGLSIVRSSMEYLGGTVEIKSELAKGTVITLTLALI